LRRSILTDLMIAAALFILPLLFFWQVTIGGKTLLPADNLYQYQPFAAYRQQMGVPAVPHNMLLSDLVLENLEWKTFLRQSISAGEIPLWNPYLFSGAPFLANGQHSGLYPFSLIYYVLPLDTAYGWFTVSQLWLAGVFMFLLMRGLGIGRFGAVISAIGYQFSSFFIASVVFQMIIAAAAWLPLLLLMVEYTLRRRPFLGRPMMTPWLIIGALGLGMTILAGHVEFVYYALLVMGFWSAFRLGGLFLSKKQTIRQLVRPAGALLGLVVLGISAGAVQFVPFLEVANASFREGSASFAQVRTYGLPPRHALAFIMPNIFGSPAQHDYFDVFTGQTTPIDWQRSDGAHVTDTMMPGGKNYVEGACYVGILTLVLAGIALAHGVLERGDNRRISKEGPYRLILFVLAAVSLSFAFGTLTYAILYYGLPGINQLHSPFRWIFPLTLCLTALAGYGAEILLRKNAGRWLGRLGVIVLALGMLVLVGAAASRLGFNALRGPITSLYHGLAGADLAFPSVEAFYSHLLRQVLIFGAFLTGAGLVVWLSRKPIHIRKVPVFVPLALILLTTDLMLASAGFNPAADPKWLNFTPPIIAWLQAHNPQEWRLSAVEGPTATLNANIPWLYGLQDVRGYDSVILKQYVEAMRSIQPQTQLLYNRVAPLYPDHLDALTNDLLNRLAVRYIVSEMNISSDKYPYQVVFEDNGLRVYENANAYPRAYLAQTTGNSLTRLPNSPVQIIESKGSQVSLNFDVRAPASTETWLVLSDTYAPGWRAYIRPQGAAEDQETERTILPAMGIFRAVSISDLPAGSYTIRFRYSPPAFQIGAFTTFLALVSMVFLIMIEAWRLIYREPTEADHATGVRRFAKNSLAPIVLNLFNRGIDLAFALVMMRLLGPANAGTYYYAVVIFGWFDILTNFGLNTLLTREVARDRSSARRYLLNSGVLRMGLGVAGIPLLAIFLIIRSSLGAPLEPLSSTAVMAIVLLYLGLFPSSISTGLSALFYAFEKAEIPAAIATITVILKAIFGLAVLSVGWGVIGLAGVSIGLNVITLGILWFSARSMLRQAEGEAKPARYDRKLVRSMIGAGWPLMLNHLLATIFFKIDVVLLEPMKGSAVVGQYSAAYKWVDAIGVIPSLFTMALLPIMARQAHEDKAAMERNYHFAVKLLFSVAFPLAIVTTFLANTLILVLGGVRYLPEGGIALALMIWFIPIGWINSLTNYVLIALDQQKAMRWAFAAGVIFNIVANLLFIPLFSYQAAAIITILSEGVLLIGFYILLRRALGPVPWIQLLWKPVAAGLGMAVTLFVLWPILPILALVAAAVVYPGVLLLLRPFSEYERERVLLLVPKRLRALVRAS